MMADGTGRNTQDILKDIVRVLTTSNSLEEAQVPDMSNVTSQINPSSSSVAHGQWPGFFPEHSLEPLLQARHGLQNQRNDNMIRLLSETLAFS